MYIRANFYTVKSGGFERAALESLSPLRSVRLSNAINCNSKVYTMSLHKLFTMLLLTQAPPLQENVRTIHVGECLGAPVAMYKC